MNVCMQAATDQVAKQTHLYYPMNFGTIDDCTHNTDGRTIALACKT